MKNCSEKNMSKIENLSTLENSNSVLSVTLYENHLKKDGSYYARVSRNTATFNNIISEIAEENKGLDPHLLQYSAILIQKKILKLLEQGKAVNILDLGTMYIAMKCNAKGKNDVSGKENFHIRFSPTQIAQDAIQSLKVDKVVYAENSPEIIEIIDLSTGENDGKITKGKPIALMGSKLKLSETDSGVYFAPVDENGNYSFDENTWIQVSSSQIFRNKPKEINLLVPETLESEKSYCIVLKTNYVSNSQIRKSLLETVSKAVTVA